MATQPLSSADGFVAQDVASTTPTTATPSVAVGSYRHGMSTRSRLLFFLVAWLIVLMPFLFWWSTWFGRQLSSQQIGEYLRDDKHPRHIQHALVQIGERLGRSDASAANWSGDLIRLASHPVEEVRNTDAWVMGQDTSVPGFHEALLKMLGDPSMTVRGNAALSLVRFGDATGRPRIVALLAPARVTSTAAGRVVDIDKVGTSIHQGGLVAKIEDAGKITEVRSPIAGRLQNVMAAAGASVSAGAEIATVHPADDQVWEALRALYLVGQAEDLPAIRGYELDLPDVSERVRQQATLTERAIQERSHH
jgi:biotin carboxyl carrier protein